MQNTLDAPWSFVIVALNHCTIVITGFIAENLYKMLIHSLYYYDRN